MTKKDLTPTRIRQMARRDYFKSNKPKSCIICDYQLHIEVSHLEPISSFDNNTPIEVINSLDNLIAFCRTHHWEYDHNYLDISDLIKQEII